VRCFDIAHIFPVTSNPDGWFICVVTVIYVVLNLTSEHLQPTVWGRKLYTNVESWISHTFEIPHVVSFVLRYL